MAKYFQAGRHPCSWESISNHDFPGICILIMITSIQEASLTFFGVSNNIKQWEDILTQVFNIFPHKR